MSPAAGIVKKAEDEEQAKLAAAQEKIENDLAEATREINEAQKKMDDAFSQLEAAQNEETKNAAIAQRTSAKEALRAARKKLEALKRPTTDKSSRPLHEQQCPSLRAIGVTRKLTDFAKR